MWDDQGDIQFMGLSSNGRTGHAGASPPQGAAGSGNERGCSMFKCGFESHQPPTISPLTGNNYASTI